MNWKSVRLRRLQSSPSFGQCVPGFKSGAGTVDCARRALSRWTTIHAVKADPTEPISLIEAGFEAQKIAFGPLIFQAARLLRELGILEALRATRSGLTLEEIAARSMHPATACWCCSRPGSARAWCAPRAIATS